MLGDVSEEDIERISGDDIQEERKIELETPIELNQYLIEPTAERFFFWITKDIILTYSDEEDIERIRGLCEIIITLHNRGMHDVAIIFFADLSAIVNTGRSRHGFERQMQQTSIGKSFQYFDAMEESKINRGGGE